MAATAVVSGTPLAEALQNAVQPKLAENGWSSGAGDDSALSEYIILMLANGKDQDQIASELANDLLGLGPEDNGPKEFAQWLFEQVAKLNAQLNGVSSQQGALAEQHIAPDEMQEDTTMGSAIDTAGANSVPTGPKSMRTGPSGASTQRGRDRRMAGQMRNALDRGSNSNSNTNDGGIHRIRGAASRVGRTDPPGGPRNAGARIQKNMANSMQRGGVQGMNPAMMAGMAQNVSPQQQMALYQMLEEQSRMMAQLLGGGGTGQMPAVNPKFFQNGSGGGRGGRGGGGKSMFERVDGRGGRGARGGANGHYNNRQQQGQEQDTPMDENSMDTTITDDGSASKRGAPSDVPCKFQLACTSPTCPFAHQSPAAPPGVSIDVSDICGFGAACTNKKCVGSHPSPAQKRQYLGSTVDCKFYPNCTNPSCPFRHPTASPCRNGADCPTKDSGCRFSHSTIACRYNPCLNPNCTFKHAEGQKGDPTSAAGQGAHVSQRRFTAEDTAGQGEELIIPGGGSGGAAETAQGQDGMEGVSADAQPREEIERVVVGGSQE